MFILVKNHGDIVEAICNCKAGQGGVSKHVAALPYTMLDYLHLGLQEIPPDMTCTQVAQKWHVPSTANFTLAKAVRFDDITFEKAEIGKEMKRPIVSRERILCALPSYARQMTPQQIENLALDLTKSGKTSFLCSALASDSYKPFPMFKTSCNVNSKLDPAMQVVVNGDKAACYPCSISKYRK